MFGKRAATPSCCSVICESNILMNWSGTIYEQSERIIQTYGEREGESDGVRVTLANHNVVESVESNKLWCTANESDSPLPNRSKVNQIEEPPRYMRCYIWPFNSKFCISPPRNYEYHYVCTRCVLLCFCKRAPRTLCRYFYSHLLTLKRDDTSSGWWIIKGWKAMPQKIRIGGSQHVMICCKNLDCHCALRSKYYATSTSNDSPMIINVVIYALPSLLQRRVGQGYWLTTSTSTGADFAWSLWEIFWTFVSFCFERGEGSGRGHFESFRTVLDDGRRV